MSPSLSSVQRSALLLVVGIVLLLGPLAGLLFPITETTYEYERVAVVAENGTVSYEEPTPQLYDTAISDDIACSGRPERACVLEAQLTDGRTLPTRSSASPSAVERLSKERYQYVQLDGQVYETVYVENESSRQIEVGLDAVSPRAALDDVAVDADSDGVPGVLAEAARGGSATSWSEVEGPGTPIATQEGYYRVYATAVDNDTTPRQLLWVTLVFFTPGVGLFLVLVVGRRFSVDVSVGYEPESDEERRSYEGPEW